MRVSFFTLRHAYRGSAPETVIADFNTLTALIAYFNASLPIINGEWGYTSAQWPCFYLNRVDSPTQGKYVPRMWLSALLGGAKVSINYDWKDDGTNAADCESNFGSVYAK